MSHRNYPTPLDETIARFAFIDFRRGFLWGAGAVAIVWLMVEMI